MDDPRKEEEHGGTMLSLLKKKDSRAEMREVMRRMRLEEARLRSAALATGTGLGSLAELQVAALAYAESVLVYREAESALLQAGGRLSYDPGELEVP